jgi:hypothetical protein
MGGEGGELFGEKFFSAECIRSFQQRDNSSQPFVLFIVSFVDSIHLSNHFKVI